MGFSVLNIYKDKLISHRYNYLSYLKYFSHVDFPNLICETFEFYSKENTKLCGFKYYYKENNNKNVVFTHGIGAGHLANMTEINALCKMGFIVYSFDITACGESSGDNIHSFLQSLYDLNSFLEYYKENISKDKITLIGHSWGGFASLNAINFNKDIIDKVISISGFVDFKYLMKQYFGILFPFFYKKIKNYEEKLHPEYFKTNILETLSKTDIPILFIHSKDDEMVKYKYSIKLVENIKNDNLHYLIVDNKNHNPYLSADGFKYYNDLMTNYHKVSKNMSIDDKLLYFKDINWTKATEEDELVMKKIENFIKN